MIVIMPPNLRRYRVRRSSLTPGALGYAATRPDRTFSNRGKNRSHTNRHTDTQTFERNTRTQPSRPITSMGFHCLIVEDLQDWKGLER